MTANQAPWWLEEGDEQCICCEQYFHFETLVLCLGCDGPVCNSCADVVLKSRETFCATCNSQSTTGDS